MAYATTILSEKRRPGKWHHTSGSTGVPLAIYRENHAELEMLACQPRLRALWGVDMSDKVVLFRHRPPTSPSLSGLVHALSYAVKSFLLQRTRFAAYQLGKDDLRQDLRRIRDLRPVLIYGNASAIYLLALEAIETGVTLDSLRLVVMTMELVSDAMHDKVQEAFHTNVITEYGAEECYVIAYGDGRHLLRVREDQVLVETLPTEDNFHRVIISVLGNPSFPLLRYEIGDLTDKPIYQVDSGFSALGHVIGRSVDYLISGQGRPIRALPLIDFLEAYPSIRRIRAHQSSDGKVLVLLEVDSIASRIPVGAIQKRLVRFLEGQNVDVRLVEVLPKTGHKHRWITSDITKPQPS